MAITDAGIFVAGVLGGPKTRNVPGKDGGAGFSYQYFYVNVGGESSARIVAGKEEQEQMVRALTPLVGKQVTLAVDVWNFRELHYLGVVEQKSA